MLWELVSSTDPDARLLADKHYSRQKPGTPRFVPPGRCKVFRIMSDSKCVAVWGTNWPYAQYVKHQWAGAWICSIFRNVSVLQSSNLIVQAIAATRFCYPQVPELGMITFIDTTKVKPIYRRSKPLWGYSFLKAGFIEVGKTKGGLITLQLKLEDMPQAQAPIIKIA
jgi:hypothetical protein